MLVCSSRISKHENNQQQNCDFSMIKGEIGGVQPETSA